MTTIARSGVGCRVLGGVDTHKDVHVAAVIDDVGRILATAEFPATRHGYRRLLAWLRGFGELVVVGVEGCGSWGAGLARYLNARGVRVVEVNGPTANTAAGAASPTPSTPKPPRGPSSPARRP
jgi:transposase